MLSNHCNTRLVHDATNTSLIQEHHYLSVTIAMGVIWSGVAVLCVAIVVELIRQYRQG